MEDTELIEKIKRYLETNADNVNKLKYVLIKKHLQNLDKITDTKKEEEEKKYIKELINNFQANNNNELFKYETEIFNKYEYDDKIFYKIHLFFSIIAIMYLILPDEMKAPFIDNKYKFDTNKIIQDALQKGIYQQSNAKEEVNIADKISPTVVKNISKGSMFSRMFSLNKKSSKGGNLAKYKSTSDKNIKKQSMQRKIKRQILQDK